ncbi:M23 family metallopeptidase [Hippea jasoniae]|uniref:M23 family metallopeptidase n=1 Tax=Hippea jasoniae TaxID=944479 RepID=UPI00054DE7DF|nr:M23 family metallopeptidase [Hippea jasoniae]
MRKGRVLFALIIFFGLIYAVYQYTPIFKPNTIEIVVKSPKAYFSANKTVNIAISDKTAPIKSIKVELISMNTTIKLFEKQFNEPLVKQFDVNFKPNKVIPQGKAVFVVSVEDYSKSNFLNGFKKVVQFPVFVDSTPPKVILLSGVSRIKIGGAALAIFYVKDTNLKDVYLGVSRDGVVDRFRAYNAQTIFGNPNVYLSFFTYRLSKLKNYSTNIYATDEAGNLTIVHVPVFYTTPKIRTSRINITDEFIKTKVMAILEHEGIPKKETLLGDFLYVNDIVRKQNYAKVKEICSKSESKILWKGRFSQLFRSAVTATFNDKRFYYYKGKLVDVKYHKGYDLASVRNARVNAANSGRVVFEGYLGVYGNTMIIDHGFGVFSLYGHLQSFLVSVGSYVKKNQYVAITDTTGLAGGDHLHFDVVVDGYYTNPVDWWDYHWIKAHILNVIDEAKTRLSLLNQ